MVGIPCVALFSARDHPGQWEPYGQGHTVLRHETDCAGCRLEVCSERGNECLRLISVEEACQAARRLLQPPLTAGRIATSAPS
jgi:ADP-heptose:LPS heptosyltransferase